MIRIEEIHPEPATVVILIDGKLDRYTLPTLQEVCLRHFDSALMKKITLDISSLNGISLEGKNYLREIKGRVIFKNLPEFLKLEL